MMPTPHLTPGEIIATLQKSSLPTLLVEGGADLSIFRWIEAKLGPLHSNVLPCGGRSTLLAVYDSRHAYAHLKTAFVADRDMWLFSAVPAQYAGIIWTEGYSIENDLYDPSLLEELLDGAEAAEHGVLIDLLAEWFAFEVEEFIAGRGSEVGRHVNEVVQVGTTTLCHRFCLSRGVRSAHPTLVSTIRSEYRLRLRGKTLLQALTRYLDRGGRVARFNYSALIHVALATTPTPHRLARIMRDVGRELAA